VGGLGGTGSLNGYERGHAALGTTSVDMVG